MSYLLRNKPISFILVLCFIYSCQGYSAPVSKPELKYLFSIDGYGDHDYFLDPQGIWFDPIHNEILIADTGNDVIGIFDVEGKCLTKLGKVKNISSPISVTTDSAGFIYWTETNTQKLKKADYRGAPIKEFDLNRDTVSQSQIIPGRLFIHEMRQLYLIDRYSGRLLKVDELDKSNPVELSDMDEPFYGEQIVDFEIDRNGYMYLLSSLGATLHVFDSTYRLISRFGKHGPEEWDVSLPLGLALGPENTIWIVDSFQHRLKVFSSTGEFLYNLGEMGKEQGKFFFPIDLIFLPDNRIYVLEKGSSRVQVFKLDYKSTE